MKILFINISDTKGGAAIAMYRLGKALEQKYNTENLFLVRSKFSDDENVIQTRKNSVVSRVEWAVNFILNVFGLQYKWLPFSPRKILKEAKKFKPDVILTAGGFVSVPLVWAGALLGKKSFVHQQDLRVGLANKLMAPFATKITVSFERSLTEYPKKKAVLTGNPVKPKILQGSKEGAIQRFVGGLSRLFSGIANLFSGWF